jgi:hypothetical protein
MNCHPALDVITEIFWPRWLRLPTLNTRQADDWNALTKRITELCTRYTAELGENAYSVFNVVTEFASHPPANRLVTRERHSLQRAAGEWVSSFTNQVRQPAFDLTAYLSSLTAPTTEPVN